MKVIVLAVVFCVASAQLSYYPEPAENNEYRQQPYGFSWEVNDAPSYNNFAHSESSDGRTVSGSYRVALPDGRMQIVTYKDDSYGYVAEVKYEGEAKYPEYRPSASYANPAYNTPTYQAPTPAYRPTSPVTPAYQAPTAPAYETLAPLYRVPAPAPASRAPASRAPTPIQKAPAPIYEAPTPTGKTSTPTYEAPTPNYKAPVVPAFKPALPNTYETQSAPVYKATGYIVPSYRPPVTTPPTSTPSSTPIESIYRSPAPKATFYRSPEKQVRY